MKLRLTIIILIITLSVGSLIIATGFISNSNYVDIPNMMAFEFFVWLWNRITFEICGQIKTSIMQLANDILHLSEIDALNNFEKFLKVKKKESTHNAQKNGEASAHAVFGLDQWRRRGENTFGSRRRIDDCR